MHPKDKGRAIQTRYLPATNFKGSRVKAWAETHSVTLSWDHGLDPFGNHLRAAEDLCQRMGWTHDLVGAGLHGHGYAFVNLT